MVLGFSILIGIGSKYFAIVFNFILLLHNLLRIFFMIYSSSSISWDTNVKHYIGNGLFDNLPNSIKAKIPKTNKHRSQRLKSDSVTISTI